MPYRTANPRIPAKISNLKKSLRIQAPSFYFCGLSALIAFSSFQYISAMIFASASAVR